MLLPKFDLPYYAVIFTSLRTQVDENYQAVNAELENMAMSIDGFLGTESTRDGMDGLGISISYWKDLQAIESWRKHSHHIMAKEKGVKDWYKSYSIRISKVESQNLFIKED